MTMSFVVVAREMEDLSVEEIDPGRLICSSPRVLGHGLHGLG